MLQQDTLIHSFVLERFMTLIKAGRLAHAYLFIGPSFVGKSSTALAVAKLVNCLAFDEKTSEGFCDQCESCQKINLGQHPDVHAIDVRTDKTVILIEQVREVLDQIKLRPFEGRKKIFIIKNVENIQRDAAHTLLKTLEEPSDNSLLLLTTSSPEKNLDTILSRCHAVYFPTVSTAVLKQYLITKEKQDPSKAHFLAYYAQGCQGRIKSLDKEEVFERKNAIVDYFVFGKKINSEVEKKMEEKESVKESLDILLSWVRDALLLKLDVEPEQFVHLDRLADLKRFTQSFTFDELNEVYKAIHTTIKLLSENLNVKIPLLVLKERLWEKSYKFN